MRMVDLVARFVAGGGGRERLRAERTRAGLAAVSLPLLDRHAVQHLIPLAVQTAHAPAAESKANALCALN